MSEYAEELNNEVNAFLLNTGRIFINGEINEDQSLNFIKRMKFLVAKNFKEIYIYINSEGGELEAAMAIIDEMEIAIKNGINIVTICTGRAYSSGAFILIWGSERYISKNACVMLHPVSYELCEDYIQIQQKYSEFSIKEYKRLIKEVAKKCGNKKIKDINNFIKSVDENIWVNSTEAIKLGIVDDIWAIKLEKGIYE